MRKADGFSSAFAVYAGLPKSDLSVRGYSRTFERFNGFASASRGKILNLSNAPKIKPPQGWLF